MDLDFELLKKFHKNECTEEEVKRVLEWFVDPSQKEKVLSSIEINWYKCEIEDSDTEQTLSQIKEKINFELFDEEQKKRSTNYRQVIWKAAAVFLLLFTVTYIFWKQNNPNTTFETDETISKNYVVKTSPRGKKLTTQLNDGSIVQLNSESKISYIENFNDSIRSIYLEGEAYFKVARNDTLPFVVTTRNLTITALGTSFNVKVYPNDEKVFVALESGKVSVKKNTPLDEEREMVLLNPGELVTFDKTNNHMMPITTYDYNLQFGWKNGILIFNEDNFSDVIKKLERWYGVDFVLLNQDTSGTWNYSGKYDKVSLENVLEGLCYTQSFDYEIKAKIVYIKFKNAN